MRIKHVSSAFFALGLFVGGAASMGLLLGFEPARLPPALINIAAYKLTFIAALFLIGAGAVVARYARRASAVDEPPAAPSRPAELGGSQSADAFEVAARQ